jgi:hypothetical protein
MTLPNPLRQKTAREKLAAFLAHPEMVYAIHYACQSFHTGAQLASTRVGCISVRQLESGEVRSFSFAKAAELLRIPPSEIPLNSDSLEKAIFEEFHGFLANNRNARFVHWNMKDETFGFPALALRARALGLTPADIPASHLVDLARLLKDLYGDGYAERVEGESKLEALGRRNALPMKHLLRGDAEAEAFRRLAFRQLQMSVQTKVQLIADVAQAAHDKTLETDASLMAVYGGGPRLMWQRILDNPGYTIGMVLVGSFVAVLKFYDTLFRG